MRDVGVAWTGRRPGVAVERARHSSRMSKPCRRTILASRLIARSSDRVDPFPLLSPRCAVEQHRPARGLYVYRRCAAVRSATVCYGDDALRRWAPERLLTTVSFPAALSRRECSMRRVASPFAAAPVIEDAATHSLRALQRLARFGQRLFSSKDEWPAGANRGVWHMPCPSPFLRPFVTLRPESPGTITGEGRVCSTLPVRGTRKGPPSSPR